MSELTERLIRLRDSRHPVLSLPDRDTLAEAANRIVELEAVVQGIHAKWHELNDPLNRDVN